MEKETGVVIVERQSKSDVQTIQAIEGDFITIECYVLNFLYEEQRFSPTGKRFKYGKIDSEFYCCFL